MFYVFSQIAVSEMYINHALLIVECFLVDLFITCLKALKDILFLVNFRLDSFIFKSTIDKVHKTVKPQNCTMYFQSS